MHKGLDLGHSRASGALTSRAEHPLKEQLPALEARVDDPIRPACNPRNCGIDGLGEGICLAKVFGAWPLVLASRRRRLSSLPPPVCRGTSR